MVRRTCLRGAVPPSESSPFAASPKVPHDGAMCDLMWSDPEESIEGWGLSPRGAGYIFGKNIVNQVKNRAPHVFSIGNVI